MSDEYDVSEELASLNEKNLEAELNSDKIDEEGLNVLFNELDDSYSNIKDSEVTKPQRNDREVMAKLTRLVTEIGNYNYNVEKEEDKVKPLEFISNDQKEQLYKQDTNSDKYRKEFITTVLLPNLLKSDNDSKAKTDTITMKDIFGDEGIKKYKLAVEEEKTDKNFIDAVLSKSLSIYTPSSNKKFNKKTVLWVGGPSASGKTTGAKIILNKLYLDLSEEYFDNTKKEIDRFIFIDGGIERERSQIRQLTLQVALLKGYTGIKDLESYWGKKIKSKIHKFANTLDNINIVIPSTFSEPYEFKYIKQYSNKDIHHLYSEIALEYKKDFFEVKRVTRYMGKSRAFLKVGNVSDNKLHNLISSFNRSPRIESKDYDEKGFMAGIIRTSISFVKYLNAMKKADKVPVYIKAVNDLVKAKLIDNDLLEPCEPRKCNTEDKILISNHYLEEWNNLPFPERKNIYTKYSILNYGKAIEKWSRFPSKPIKLFMSICIGTKEVKKCNVKKEVEFSMSDEDYRKCLNILNTVVQLKDFDENSKKSMINMLNDKAHVDNTSIVQQCLAYATKFNNPLTWVEWGNESNEKLSPEQYEQYLKQIDQNQTDQLLKDFNTIDSDASITVSTGARTKFYKEMNDEEKKPYIETINKLLKTYVLHTHKPYTQGMNDIMSFIYYTVDNNVGALNIFIRFYDTKIMDQCRDIDKFHNKNALLRLVTKANRI